MVPLDPLDAQGKLWVLSLQVGDRSERFLLDTGASTSLITPALAEHLGSRGQVVPPEQLELAMAGDRCPQLQARLHRLPSLRVGLAETQGLTALALAGSLIPPGVAGILGWDFLGGYRWQLDPQQRLLYLQAQQPRAWDTPKGAIALIPRAGVYLAPVSIAGQGPFLMLVDTGAESTFISQRVAAQVLRGSQQQAVTVLGFCGQESATLATLPSLQLGQHRIQDLEAVVLGESAILQSLNVDGILGQNVLNRFVQTWAAGGNLDQRPVLGLQPFSRQP
jgi:predicted aspartyl protease